MERSFVPTLVFCIVGCYLIYPKSPNFHTQTLHIADNPLNQELTKTERERIARLALVIIELFPQILRVVFQHCYKKPPNFLLMDFQGKKKKELNSSELTMINKCHSTNSLDSLDTTILCKLFSLLKLTQRPARGWRQPPPDTATSIQDDVERMRCLRNEIVHRPNIAITQTDFDDYFFQISLYK